MRTHAASLSDTLEIDSFHLTTEYNKLPRSSSLSRFTFSRCVPACHAAGTLSILSSILDFCADKRWHVAKTIPTYLHISREISITVLLFYTGQHGTVFKTVQYLPQAVHLLTCLNVRLKQTVVPQTGSGVWLRFKDV